jgi:hypothetical protein
VFRYLIQNGLEDGADEGSAADNKVFLELAAKAAAVEIKEKRRKVRSVVPAAEQMPSRPVSSGPTEAVPATIRGRAMIANLKQYSLEPNSTNRTQLKLSIPKGLFNRGHVKAEPHQVKVSVDNRHDSRILIQLISEYQPYVVFVDRRTAVLYSNHGRAVFYVVVVGGRNEVVYLNTEKGLEYLLRFKNNDSVEMISLTGDRLSVMLRPTIRAFFEEFGPYVTNLSA